jgi:hypothetical protein
VRCVLAVCLMLCAACGSKERRSSGSGHLVITSPREGERTLAQPLAIVGGQAFDGRGVSVTWENRTTGTIGTGPVKSSAEPCVVVLPCPPIEDRTVVHFAVAIPLAPGANQLRVTASDLDASWALDDVELSFIPGPDGPAVHIRDAYPPQDGLGCALVAGEGNGLVALEWRNELTGASAAIDRTWLFGDPTDLTDWGACIPIAPGTNGITVRGTGWNGALVEDRVSVTGSP